MTPEEKKAAAEAEKKAAAERAASAEAEDTAPPAPPEAPTAPVETEAPAPTEKPKPAEKPKAPRSRKDARFTSALKQPVVGLPSGASVHFAEGEATVSADLADELRSVLDDAAIAYLGLREA